jgi:hypothetical protein
MRTASGRLSFRMVHPTKHSSMRLRTAINRVVTTRHQRIAQARLLGPHLTRSRRAFSVTLSTPVLDRRTSRGLRLPCRATAEDHQPRRASPPSPMQHRIGRSIFYIHLLLRSCSQKVRPPSTARLRPFPGQTPDMTASVVQTGLERTIPTATREEPASAGTGGAAYDRVRPKTGAPPSRTRKDSARRRRVGR